ncbi:hypothetical protein DPEC_G00320880 [Dallia pectoralis]|uniref:Uncharacterized protein n=1 Tax=Dallia pectoralis TaxID=75939 RepID=A0ACC2FA56_DALPE|nr:hypothetical protein DPEC_G00320880 [Dallia pectoralis]
MRQSQRPRPVPPYLPVSAEVMAISGGGHRARLVGLWICSASGLGTQSCCSAIRKANGGSWRFLQERRRTWKGSISLSVPLPDSGESSSDTCIGRHVLVTLSFSGVLRFVNQSKLFDRMVQQCLPLEVTCRFSTLLFQQNLFKPPVPSFLSNEA